MTAHKVADLLGAELDCAVAKAMGLRWSFVPTDPEFGLRRALCVAEITPNPHIDGFPVFAPSTRWEHGGPIIEQERIDLEYEQYGGGNPAAPADHWRAALFSGGLIYRAIGSTVLLAAMRAFVASKLGDTVELP